MAQGGPEGQVGQACGGKRLRPWSFGGARVEPSGANGFSLGGWDPREGRLDQSSLAPAAPLSEDLGSHGGSAHPLPSVAPRPRSPWHPLLCGLCVGAQGPHVEHGQAPPVGLVPHGTIPPMGARPMALWGRGSKGITLRNTAHIETGWYHLVEEVARNST